MAGCVIMQLYLQKISAIYDWKLTCFWSQEREIERKTSYGGIKIYSDISFDCESVSIFWVGNKNTYWKNIM